MRAHVLPRRYARPRPVTLTLAGWAFALNLALWALIIAFVHSRGWL